MLYVGSQVLSTLVATATADPNQRRLMLLLPIVFIAFLYRFPAYIQCWREVIAAEKKREHRCGGQLRSVGGPDHAWERTALKLVGQCRASFAQAASALAFADASGGGASAGAIWRDKYSINRT